MNEFGTKPMNADLKSIGLKNLGDVYWNLEPAELIEHAIVNDQGVFTNNGAMPADLILGVTAGKTPGADMLLDGCVDPALPNADGALSNCFPNNGAATFLNFDLCQDNGGMTEDLETVNCTHAPLAGQS